MEKLSLSITKLILLGNENLEKSCITEVFVLIILSSQRSYFLKFISLMKKYITTKRSNKKVQGLSSKAFSSFL